ncbi:MAG: type II secretion system F family protein, partial [Gammaproteobacteria bacterium]
MEPLLDGPMPWVIMAAWALSGACFMLLVFWINSLVEEEDRAFMDPLPPLLKLVWPFIRIIDNFVCSFLPYEYMEHTETRLQRTGVGYLLTAEQFVALQILMALVTPLLVWICLVALHESFPLAIIVAPLLGFLFPNVWLSDTRKRREIAVIRAMPIYLDFITMCVEAGLNLSGALAQAMEKAPPGPLRNEFAIVLRDLRSGLTRADALRRMADRLDITEVTSFVSAIVQAERMGASLA